MPPLGVVVRDRRQRAGGDHGRVHDLQSVVGNYHARITTIAAAAAQAIPVPAVNFPPNITGASHGRFGRLHGHLRTGRQPGSSCRSITTSVHHHRLHYAQYTSTPPQGPRAVSVARDGSYAVMGWMQRQPGSRRHRRVSPISLRHFNIGGHARRFGATTWSTPKCRRAGAPSYRPGRDARFCRFSAPTT